ncbi:MAG: hypothetical protein U5L45_09960 [Saprospiraceae bacterium]|nr:hypothetical protein [Saprospiraceae bacterium]
MTSSIFAHKKDADLIIHNAKVYTVNELFDMSESFAVKAGRIIGMGSSQDILSKFQSVTTIDTKGKTVLDGLIDVHAHFYRYGESWQTVDLVGTKRWQEVLKK